MRFSNGIVVQLAGLMMMTTGTGLAGEEWIDTIRSQERQVASLRAHVDVLRQRKDERQAQRELLAELRGETLRLSLQLERLRGQVHDIETDTRDLEEQFSRYRELYRSSARIEAVGEKLPELSTASGKRYREVTIRRVTETGLVIWHQDGTTRVVYNDLPPQIRDRFQWDEDLAREQLEEEAERELRRDQYLARLASQQRAEAEKRKQQEERAAIDRRIAALEQQTKAQRAASKRTSSLETSWRLGATRPFGTGSIYRYRHRYYRDRYSSRYHRPTVRYYPVYTTSSCRTPPRSVVSPRSVRSRGSRSSTRSRTPVSSVSPTICPK